MSCPMSAYATAFLKPSSRKRGRSGPSPSRAAPFNEAFDGSSPSPVQLPQRRRMQANVPANVQQPLNNVQQPLNNADVPTNTEDALANTNAGIRIKNDYLVKFTAKQKEQITVLTKMVQKYQEEQEQPKCCQIPYVKVR